MSGFVHTLCQIFTKLALFQENYDRAPNEKSKQKTKCMIRTTVLTKSMNWKQKTIRQTAVCMKKQLLDFSETLEERLHQHQ